MTTTNGHVLRLKRRSVPVWLYTTLWGFPIEDADFCKLFWATLLAPVGFYLWLVGRLLPKSIAKGYQLATGTKVLSGVGVAGDRVASFFQRHENVIPVAMVLGVLGAVVVWALTNFESFWITIAAIVVVAAVCVLIAVTPAGRFLRRGVRTVKSRTCPRVEIKPANAMRKER